MESKLGREARKYFYGDFKVIHIYCSVKGDFSKLIILVFINLYYLVRIWCECVCLRRKHYNERRSHS